MPQLKSNSTIKEYQQFVKDVYGLNNDRYFSLQDMLANVERFMTRSLKGIRKNDYEKIKINLIISLSWFSSMMNQLHIDIEEEIWKRFPYRVLLLRVLSLHLQGTKNPGTAESFNR